MYGGYNTEGIALGVGAGEKFRKSGVRPSRIAGRETGTDFSGDFETGASLQSAGAGLSGRK
jgi:hypothetical protein